MSGLQRTIAEENTRVNEIFLLIESARCVTMVVQWFMTYLFAGGQVMMLEIAQHVMTFLHKYDRPQVSLHQEMVLRQKEEETTRRRKIEAEEQKSRMRVVEEVSGGGGEGEERRDGWVREVRGGGSERKRWRGEEEADGNKESKEQDERGEEERGVEEK